jgi:L-ascorbate metabolism protein UlaG (beta-lactamase superfamily)
MTDASVTFIGNATTLLRLGGFTLLTDPNFLHAGQRAYLGNGLWSRRLIEPAASIDELPPLDAVLLSHLHGDHFDRVARRGLPRSTPVITTRHAARRLHRHFPAVPLAVWSSEELRRSDQVLRITAVPGEHAPGALRRLLPPVMGSIVDLEQGGRRLLRLYLTGDTLMRPVLGPIPERFPDIDVMLIHLGGATVFGVLVSMDGRQGTDLVELVRPELTVPVHYDDYRVMRSPLSDFIAEARRRRVAGVRPIGRGETLSLPIRTTER